jgi:hypothetical protein
MMLAQRHPKTAQAAETPPLSVNAANGDERSSGCVCGHVEARWLRCNLADVLQHQQHHIIV